MSQEVRKNEAFLYHQPETLSRSLIYTRWSFQNVPIFWREVVVYGSFQLQGFDWKKFGVLDGCGLWQVVAYGRWSHTEP